MSNRLFLAWRMAFPDTRKTLIQRLTTGGAQADWREFMSDYWGPVCRFAQGRGNLTDQDAEDVAGDVFEVMLKNRLLERWSHAQSAKLRTLICSVVRKVLANRFRVAAGRERVVREHGGRLDRYADFSEFDPADAPSDQLDAFYAAWVDDTLQATVESLLAEYDRSGRGDYFRVLYGRLCEDLPMREIAEMLQIKHTDAENYYRHARLRLSERLQELIREHVLRYSGAQQISEEFATEWARVGEYLRERGGLETAVRKVYEQQKTQFKPTGVRK
jgi:DNA-directed RNA polymerase specialized sigma24 family protein